MSDDRQLCFRILGGPYCGIADPSEADGWEPIAALNTGRFPPGFILTRNPPKRRAQLLEKPRPRTWQDVLDESFKAAAPAPPPPGAQRYLYLLRGVESGLDRVRLTYRYAGPPTLEDSMEQTRRAVEQAGEDE